MQSEVQLWFPCHHQHIHHILLSDKGGGGLLYEVVENLNIVIYCLN
jgi:hypothetical protein